VCLKASLLFQAGFFGVINNTISFYSRGAGEWLKEDMEMSSWFLQQNNKGKECPSNTDLKRENSLCQFTANTRMRTNKNIFQ